jgi:hypothetical protein
MRYHCTADYCKLCFPSEPVLSEVEGEEWKAALAVSRASVFLVPHCFCAGVVTAKQSPYIDDVCPFFFALHLRCPFGTRRMFYGGLIKKNGRRKNQGC